MYLHTDLNNEEYELFFELLELITLDMSNIIIFGDFNATHFNDALINDSKSLIIDN